MTPHDDPYKAAEMRLATYGTLSPGESNHQQLAALHGHWRRGTVRGHLVDGGWGSALGFPGLVLNPSGPAVEVWLFESADLPLHWARLDEFEGDAYRRVVTDVHTSEGDVSACLYALARQPEDAVRTL